VSSRATAAVVAGVMGGCIYALNPSVQSAFVVSGSGAVHSGCGVWINSSHPKALQVTGGGSLTVSSGDISVVGDDIGSNTNISPAPTTGIAHFADPLASIPAPPVGYCDHSSQVSISGGTEDLYPGVYCGGISISQGDVTFHPGMYILNGGGLVVSSSSSHASGSGLMFYNTGDASHAFSRITVSGGATVDFSAPTSGSYGNILFFEDRSKGGASVQNTFSGGSMVNLTGVIYTRNSEVVYSGGSSTINPNLGIVADQLTFSGGAYLQAGLNGGGAGTGAKVALID
jgi:hypothetical protein